MKSKKILYFGGQKSGKSSLAEAKALVLASKMKPYYIATYDDSYNDQEMLQRINKHKKQRTDKFITIEKSHNLEQVILPKNTYLIDCMSMWLLNNLEKKEEEILIDIEKILTINSNIVFVLNDINSGIIPIDKESRRFVDLTGIIGQKLASLCDEVYEVKLGLSIKLK